MSDTEATLGASGAPIPAENGSREAEYSPPSSGCDGGVKARTGHWLRLRHDEGGHQEIIDPTRIAAQIVGIRKNGVSNLKLRLI